MKLILVADTFPPLRTSGAVQLRDLSRELVHQGHHLTVCLPSWDINVPWLLEEIDEIEILRLKSPKTKDLNYLLRTINEFLMPYSMMRGFKKSPLCKKNWDGIIWYSPSIFHGPFIKMLKHNSSCKGYLIVRDIFPEWALDMGLMSKGLPYRFFNAIAQYQYSIADFIGVQSPGNKVYFRKWAHNPGRYLQVLNNWLRESSKIECSIRIAETDFADRKVFVYAGNMGIAQDIDILIDLARLFHTRSDIGFLFVGRGADVNRLKNKVNNLELSNILFFDEVHPDEIPDLYSQCTIGIVSLDARHKSHNIPGKFLTYMQSGLPVLAKVNHGNDLVKIIQDQEVGQVSDSNDLNELKLLAEKLIYQVESGNDFYNKCISLYNKDFSSRKAVEQIIRSLENIEKVK